MDISHGKFIPGKVRSHAPRQFPAVKVSRVTAPYVHSIRDSVTLNIILRLIVAYEQALWDALAAGLEREGELATTSLEFEYICIEKVDAKCWLEEMTLVMTSLPQEIWGGFQIPET